MRIQLDQILSFFFFLPTVTSLQCFTGPSGSPYECSSLSHCLTVRSKTGQIQRSCDKSSMHQVSWCNIPSKGISNRDRDYFLNGPTHSQKQRSNRYQSEQSCFNAGDFGEICCCSTDYCNISNNLSIFGLPFLFILFYLMR